MGHKNRYKLKEWEELTDSEKATVLGEYKKGWHFLLIWSAVFVAFIIGGLSYLTEPYFRAYQGYKHFLGVLVITCIISKISSLFWERFIAPKVIKDLIHDLKREQSQNENK